MRGAIVTQALETLARTQNHSVSLGIHSAPERVASFLRDLKTKEANLGDQTDRLKLPMTRQSIGEYLGLTLETVSRAISKLKREKVIEMLSPSEIRIPDMKALSARCASG
jgi:CRP-like cAMP-binding protein